MKSFIRTMLMCAILLYSTRVLAEGQSKITLGFPEWNDNVNLLTSEDPAAEFVRKAITDVLLVPVREDEANAAAEFKLKLSDSIRVSADRMRWSLRIRKSGYFSNGTRITGKDVTYSIERCRTLGMFSELDTVSFKQEGDSTEAPYWVEFVLRAGSSPDRLAIDLGHCPIVERISSTLFAGELGTGALVTSAGNFGIESFKAGHVYSLSRRYGDSEEKSGVGSIEVRAFSESKQGLTSLRSGSIDALVTKDNGVISTASSDQTLSSYQCGAYTIVARKGLKFSCSRDFSVVDIGFVS